MVFGRNACKPALPVYTGGSRMCNLRLTKANSAIAEAIA